MRRWRSRSKRRGPSAGGERLLVIDTNVVVAALLSRDGDSAPRRLLAGMLTGGFSFVLSPDLLAEYRRVLLRPAIRERHELTTSQVDNPQPAERGPTDPPAVTLNSPVLSKNEFPPRNPSRTRLHSCSASSATGWVTPCSSSSPLSSL